MQQEQYFFPDQARANVQQQYNRVWSIFEEHMWHVFRHIENESKLGRVHTIYYVTPQLSDTGTMLPVHVLKRYIGNQLQAIRYGVQDAGQNALQISWDDESINRKPPVPSASKSHTPQLAASSEFVPRPVVPAAPTSSATLAPATMPPNARPRSLPQYANECVPTRKRRTKTAVGEVPTRVLKLN